MCEGTTKGEETPQNIEVVESAKDEGRNRSQASMGVTFHTQNGTRCPRMSVGSGPV